MDLLVLLLLASKLSQVISPQELLAALWPDTIFSPAAIQRCIAQLRKVMGDNAGQANKDIYGRDPLFPYLLIWRYHGK
jgi:DNA-binding winged helix-turn-helix (wHTH) protein